MRNLNRKLWKITIMIIYKLCIVILHGFYLLFIRNSYSKINNCLFQSKVCTQIQLSDSSPTNVLTSQVPICINILDENDNYPQIFLFGNYWIIYINALYSHRYFALKMMYNVMYCVIIYLYVSSADILYLTDPVLNIGLGIFFFDFSYICYCFNIN